MVMSFLTGFPLQLGCYITGVNTPAYKDIRPTAFGSDPVCRFITHRKFVRLKGYFNPKTYISLQTERPAIFVGPTGSCRSGT